jgi:hypothetical protein
MKSILIFLTMLLVGTQAVIADSSSLDVMGKVINPDVVTVYAYRPKKWGGALIVFELEMTDLEGTVALKNKTFFVQKTDLDGAFEFEGSVKGYPGAFEIFTELGKVYYVRCFLNDKGIAAKPAFELVDPETARAEMKKLKPARLSR